MILLLDGPARNGKTTFIRSLMHHHPAVTYHDDMRYNDLVIMEHRIYRDAAVGVVVIAIVPNLPKQELLQIQGLVNQWSEHVPDVFVMTPKLGLV